MQQKHDYFELAKNGYGAYGKAASFKNFLGNPMLAWDELPESIQMAWMAAAKEIVESLH